MPKRQARPWDRGLQFKERLAQAEAMLAVPSVEVDGVVYRSDRFYLHSCQDEALPALPTCRCGSKEAPPQFPREAFVKSLDLKAAIFGTYTINLNWMAREFPSLVGPTSHIPTLILHGHKGLTKLLIEKETFQEEDYCMSDYEPQENSQPSIDTTRPGQVDFRLPPVFSPQSGGGRDDNSSVDDGGGSLLTQEDQIASPPAFLKINNSNNRSPFKTRTTNPQPQELFADDVQSPDEKIKKKLPKQPRITMSTLGDACHLTQIVSNWKPPKDPKVSEEPISDDRNDENKNGTPREFKRGVHHPKFMMLFETSGDIVVVVSTANLSKTRSLEGSWIQRFQCRRQPAVPTAASNSGTGNNGANDFGFVLADFLFQLSSSSLPRETRVEEFFSRYLSMELDDLPLRYHFEKAQVHLVPVIPGNWKRKPKKSQRFVYGRQRVHHVLSQVPDLIKSKRDTLLIQPTSFGGNWKQAELADVVRSYMGYSGSERPKDYWNEAALLEKLRIVWPTYNYMRSISPSISVRHLQREVNQLIKPGPEEAPPPTPDDGVLFLSTQLFNSCDKSCVVRMAQYKASVPSQRKPLVPHFKSVARLCRKPSKDYPSSDTCLSWFLLTSACFSHGAQGKGVASTGKDDPLVEYANFELGVLFTSRARESRKRGARIYCFRPTKCSCEQQGILSSSPKLIHLPVPYCLQPELYLEDDDSDDDDDETDIMKETPFFHEIEKGNQCVGNMLLTPYGVEQMSKKRKARKP